MCVKHLCRNWLCHIHCVNPCSGDGQATVSYMRNTHDLRLCALNVRLMYQCSFHHGFMWLVFMPCKGYKGEGPFKLVISNVTSCVKHVNEIISFQTWVGGDSSCVLMQESPNTCCRDEVSLRKIPQTRLEPACRTTAGAEGFDR